MSQDPYTTRKDIVLPGKPSPAESEAGQDGPDVTPALGAPYPQQPPPAVEFGQTVLDQPVRDLRQTALDQTAPVSPQQPPVQPAPGAPQDRQVAPLPQAAPQPPQPQQGYAPQGYPPPQQQGYAPPQGHQQAFAPQGYAQQPPPAPAAPAPASSQGAWHRQHYAIGVFLVLYGLTNLVTGLLGFSNRKMEVAGYLGDGMAGTVLIAVKCVEALLLVVTVAGLVRRRDVWFLPALLGWVLGFGVLCVLDLVNGEFVTLIEHLVYAALFAVLLFVSYGLSAKVRAAQVQAASPGQAPQAGPVPAGVPQAAAPAQGGPAPSGLSRTQEIALNALNRWQRQ